MIPGSIHHQFLNQRFHPLQFFSGGEYGFIYDFSDKSTLWQDTGATSSITSSGQSIKRVDDLSGNSLNLTEPTNPPTYTESGSLAYADFDGVSNVLTSGVFTDNLLDGGSVFIASAHDDDETLGWVLSEYLDAATGSRLTLCHDTRAGTKRLLIHRVDGANNNFIDLDSDLDTSEYVIGFADDGSTATGYVDGASQSDTADTSTNFSAGDRRIMLGNRPDSNAFFDGKVYAAVGIDREFTSSEISDLNKWLSAKAGI